MHQQEPDFDIATDWRLETTPEELTAIVLDPQLIHLWCPSVFMEAELLERGRPDGLGMSIRLYTKGLLPHSFVFTAEIVDLVPHRSMTIAVRGDFEGAGFLKVEPAESGFCVAGLHWRTDIRHPYIKYVKRILRPVFKWNHKWAMRRARSLMQEEIFRRRRASNQFTRAQATFPHNIKSLRTLLRRDFPANR